MPDNTDRYKRYIASEIDWTRINRCASRVAREIQKQPIIETEFRYETRTKQEPKWFGLATKTVEEKVKIPVATYSYWEIDSRNWTNVKKSKSGKDLIEITEGEHTSYCLGKDGHLFVEVVITDYRTIYDEKTRNTRLYGHASGNDSVLNGDLKKTSRRDFTPDDVVGFDFWKKDIYKKTKNGSYSSSMEYGKLRVGYQGQGLIESLCALAPQNNLLGRNVTGLLKHLKTGKLLVNAGQGRAGFQKERWEKDEMLRFIYIPEKNAYRIISMRDNKCFDVSGAKADNGTALCFWKQGDGDNQFFLVKPLGWSVDGHSDAFALSPVFAKHKNLDYNADTNWLCLWNAHGGSEQQFCVYFVSVDDHIRR
jgi:hypothetical protein